MRLKSKQNVLRTIVEERIAVANHTRPQKLNTQEVKVGEAVDLYRTPDRKDQEGWRGPCDLLDLNKSGAIVVWNGYPYIVPLRHIRKHLPLIAWQTLIKFTTANMTNSKYFLVTEYTKLLDIVEGSTLFKNYLIGRIIGQDGHETTSPPDLEQSPPEVFVQAQRLTVQEWQIEIDGIIFGRGIKRLYLVNGASYGKQVVWDCTKRQDYQVRDITPSRQSIELNGDVNTCSIVFYSFQRPPEDTTDLDKYIIPNLSDLSGIDWDPEDGDISDLPLQYWPGSGPPGPPPSGPSPPSPPGGNNGIPAAPSPAPQTPSLPNEVSMDISGNSQPPDPPAPPGTRIPVPDTTSELTDMTWQDDTPPPMSPQPPPQPPPDKKRPSPIRIRQSPQVPAAATDIDVDDDSMTQELATPPGGSNDGPPPAPPGAPSQKQQTEDYREPRTPRRVQFQPKQQRQEEEQRQHHKAKQHHKSKHTQTTVNHAHHHLEDGN